MIKVYIAGPYTARTEHGKKHNTDIASLVAAEFIVRGFQPFVPHLSHYIDIISPHPLGYETWMEQDFQWLAVCDCLFRLPGKSSGADREVEFAEKHGIPVYRTYEDVEAFRDFKLYGKDALADDEVGQLWRDTYKPIVDGIVAGKPPIYDTALAQAVLDKDYVKIAAYKREQERLHAKYSPEGQAAAAEASREAGFTSAFEQKHTFAQSLAELARANGFTYPPADNSGARDLDTLTDDDDLEPCDDNCGDCSQCDAYYTANECDACGICTDCNPGLKQPALTGDQEFQTATLIQRFAPLFGAGFEIVINPDGSIGIYGKARL